MLIGSHFDSLYMAVALIQLLDFDYIARDKFVVLSASLKLKHFHLVVGHG